MRVLSESSARRINSDGVIEVGPIRMDRNSQTVAIDGHALHPTGKEFQVLELLLERYNTVVTKKMFLVRLYDGVEEPKMKIIDVFICKLRKKLAGAACVVTIDTVSGRGYIVRCSTVPTVQAVTLQPAKPHELPAAIPDPWHTLPSVDTTRWVASRKLAILEAIADTDRPKITAQSAMIRYGLSSEELNEWTRALEAHGYEGLKTTKIQMHL